MGNWLAPKQEMVRSSVCTVQKQLQLLLANSKQLPVSSLTEEFKCAKDKAELWFPGVRSVVPNQTKAYPKDKIDLKLIEQMHRQEILSAKAVVQATQGQQLNWECVENAWLALPLKDGGESY